ncbi:diacylglycerol O-acyltransferase 2-like [Nymphaea colorata]|nr:diacylglycerol O-acyltransferase 2-like [Nymphaea colorata]
MEKPVEGEAVSESREGCETTVIRSPVHSTFHTMTAVVLWLGTIHLNLVVLGLAFLFSSSSTMILLLIGLMVLLAVGPVDEESRLGKAIVRYICEHGLGYFPVTVHIEDIKAFHSNQAYVLAVEPHSVFPISCLPLLNITGTMPWSKTKALASNAVFYTPFLRQLGTWQGLIPVTKNNFVKHLEAGYSCIVIPGGVREIMYMNPAHEVAFLKSRQGFVRVAIETGRPLVPVFSFGQTNVYRWWKPEGKLYVRIARAIRFAPLLFWGAFGSPIPYRRPMHVVVGRPIEVKQNLTPSVEEVAEVHARFITDLEQLFHRHKAAAGHADADLKIV